MLSARPNPTRDPILAILSEKRTAILQIFSLIDSLQPILVQEAGPIETSQMEFVEAGLEGLITKLKAIDITNYALFIDFFTRKLKEFKKFYADKYKLQLPPFKHADGTVSADIYTPKTLPKIPQSLAAEISHHFNMFKISSQDFLTQTMRPKGAFTTLLTENLATNLTLALQRIPKPSDTGSLLMDWNRDEFADVNGESFNFYKRHFPYATSSKMIQNFCKENGLSEEQTSFVLSQAHQHALGGLLAYILDPFRNNLDEKRIPYSPSFINGNMISIKGRPGQPLVMNCRAVLYVKNLMVAKDIIPLVHVGFTLKADNLTRRYPEIRVDSELVHGNCFVPTMAMIKLQFAFIDKANDPYGLKRLFRETIVCGENHIARIEETFLSLAETSLMFDEPALVPLILDREF